METTNCPFCGYHAHGDYQIMLHMEEFHPENGESPFIVKDDPDKKDSADKSPDEDNFAMCSVEGCGEVILLAELDNHIELHALEDAGSTPEVKSNQASIKETPTSSLAASIHSVGTQLSKQEKAIASWKELFHMPDKSSSKGDKPQYDKSQLGPHANENKMPDWVRKILENDGREKPSTRVGTDGKTRKVMAAQNQTKGILPVISQLLHQDKTTSYAYLCHPAVQHVSKLPREGGFCGYRNIQTVSSYIINTKSQGYPIFNGKIPSIFQIQDYIENAWDIGINKQGRAETGGIRGTRKYIGTPEAQAMFISLDISCNARGIKAKGETPAYERLFNEVEAYFKAGVLNPEAKVQHTMLSPLYYQQPGHSMTIVGFEKKNNGDTNILVFDPMFHDSSAITKFIGNDKISHNKPAELLKAYRRDTSYLRRFKEFELLKLTPPKA